jgi:chemotaxis protein methyltransferase CheR
MITESSIMGIRGVLTETQFNKFADFITKNLGISMPPKKRQMLQSRLMRRVRELGLSTFDDYFRYVFHDGGLDDELQNLINAVTTNKTEFLREPGHFNFLAGTVLPGIVRAGGDRRAAVWCAGCSTGEEPYSLAVTMEEFAAANPGFSYSITATDVSTKALRAAGLAIYSGDTAGNLPPEIKRKYFMRSKDREKDLVRVVPELRARVRFLRLNFMDRSYDCVPGGMDIIFFRNVMIYFSRAVQESVLLKMAEKLTPGGWLFTGHSESLRDLKVPFAQAGAAVYVRV